MTPELPVPDIREPGAGRTGMVRVGIGLLVGTVGYILPFGAASTVLLPDLIARLQPEDKVPLLGVLTAASAVVGLVSNVVFGALSDRTRSRFGARNPWIIGGAVATALLLVPVPLAGSFGTLLFWWLLAVTALNATVAALTAVVPDRVPAGRRATLSAVVGVGLLFGTALGTVTGAAFIDRPVTGFVVIALAMVTASAVAVLVAPDHGNTDGPRGGLDVRGLAGSFRAPRHAPDFYWALWGRMLLVLGYFMIYGFQFYIFTDRLGLDAGATARALGVNSVIFLVAALAGSAVTGPVSDRLQRRKVFVMAAAALACVSIAIPLAAPTVAGMAGFACVGGVAFGLYWAVDAALMTEVLPSSTSRARDLGILNMATTGGQALAPTASAGMLALDFGFLPVFVGAMIACAIGALCIPPIRSVR